MVCMGQGIIVGMHGKISCFRINHFMYWTIMDNGLVRIIELSRNMVAHLTPYLFFIMKNNFRVQSL